MRRRLGLVLAAAGAVAALAGVGAGLSQIAPMPAAPPDSALGPLSPLQPRDPYAGHTLTTPQLFSRALPAGTSSQVARGRYLTIASDCAACHTPQGAAPFSGGLGLHTPFGTIYSPNLTSDVQTGIGAWTNDQFWRAMHEGIGNHGEHLYPAFPYPSFTRVTRADSDAILAYLKTIPPVHSAPVRNALPFPFNIRALMIGWNLLFFRPARFQPAPNQSAEYNRGAYLVETLGHCGACHTPKNMLGADKKGQDYQGGKLEAWYAPNLTSEARTGLGGWSRSDLVEFLRTGRNVRAQAGGSMAEVISDSTSLMSDADLNAIAIYLKSLQAAGASGSVRDADKRALTAGRAVYEDACSACHRMGGEGVPRFFPKLAGHPDVQSRDPNNLVRVILEGARTAPSSTRPTPLSMPSYAWKLNDQEIADVATYVRQSWGNRADPVGEHSVTTLRQRLHLSTSHPSAWSRE